MIKSRGVVQDVRTVCRSRHRLAAFVGFLIGGIIPLAVYITAHRQGFQWVSPAGSVALGGLGYSVPSVYQWARQAFGQVGKSLGFVVLLEGVMVTSPTVWLAVTALVYLMVINGVSAGVQLALGSRTAGTVKATKTT